MTRGDPRVREVFSRLRGLLDLLEDIANHPHKLVEPPRPATAPPSPAVTMPDAADARTPVPLLVSVKEARRLIGISNSNMYVLINNGSIETVRVGGRRLVRYSSLQLLAERTDK